MHQHPSTLPAPRPDCPRPEYPRPDRERPSAGWLNLNGSWEFLPDESSRWAAPDDLPSGTWPDTILVPFAWETTASGVERPWLETAWYRTVVDIPGEWSGRHVFLCFGAVHHEASIWVNGRPVGEHVGGYVPFELNLGDAGDLGPRAEVVIRVHAPADKRSIPHGKQRSIPRDDYDGVSFTPSSGIWQTVWLEARPATYVERIDLRGDSLTGIDATVVAAGPCAAGAQVTIRIDGDAPVEPVRTRIGDDGAARVFLPVTEPRLWSPANPYLYRVTTELDSSDGTDVVTSYTGLRRVTTDGERLFLNDEPLYVRGVLDQGYWPATGITAPSSEALHDDLRLAAAAGFNLVRKHLKLEDPLWLHGADRMGILVWAEPACTSRFTPDGVAAFEEQIAPMVHRDGNHPSIIIWGLYNEEWGLDWEVPGDIQKKDALRRAYDLLADLDRTRPIVDNSGWTHVKTDLVDWHYYDESPSSWAHTLAELAADRETFPVRLGPDHVEHKAIYADDGVPRTGVPYLNGEYGGGFTSLERGWHLRWQTQELRRHARVCGYVYTELTDVEHETAGLYYADRTRKDLGGFDPAIVHAPTTLIFDVEPIAAGTDLAPGTDEFDVPVRISHHGPSSLRTVVKAAWTSAGAPWLGDEAKVEAEAGPVAVEPFVVSEPVTIRTALPEGWAAGRLWCWTGDDPTDAAAVGFLDVGFVEHR
ncbi:glycoside hydrolase family 2 protein [Phytoactinopolyspora halotolerans]|uniref:Glycoside hydrolase family 2 n=1 Tax=Phytoactinopolyspora halotolerans TaxID=1981512 RepID=A0A6L9SI16_9ACTN|nr:glycoside hydrolase family 2 TIM barrel-domain containing protein [Phytoactinopolyspora halotolerans]NEE04767.1 glycoside hydrolase family 2 [Phytoactinopolyspora halotolerans]